MSVNILHSKTKSIHLALLQTPIEVELGPDLCIRHPRQTVCHESNEHVYLHHETATFWGKATYDVLGQICDVKGGVFQITLQGYLSEVFFILSTNKLSYDRSNYDLEHGPCNLST